jgi:hypothetical protein
MKFAASPARQEIRGTQLFGKEKLYLTSPKRTQQQEKRRKHRSSVGTRRQIDPLLLIAAAVSPAPD